MNLFTIKENFPVELIPIIVNIANNQQQNWTEIIFHSRNLEWEFSRFQIIIYFHFRIVSHFHYGFD